MSDDSYTNRGPDRWYGDEAVAEKSGNTLIVAAIAGSVGLVIGSFIWNVYSEGLRLENGELPIVGADLGAYKIKSTRTQTDGIPHSELRVLDPDLQARDKAIRDNSVDGDVIEANLPASTGQGGPALSVDTTSLPPPEFLQNDNVSGAANFPERTPNIRPSPYSEPASNRPTYEAQASSRNYGSMGIGNFDVNGPFLVQLAALRTELDARKLLDKQIATYPNLFVGAQPHIQRADLGARGVWYRLKVDGFNTRAAAKSYCARLKTQNIDCLVSQR